MKQWLEQSTYFLILCERNMPLFDTARREEWRQVSHICGELFHFVKKYWWMYITNRIYSSNWDQNQVTHPISTEIILSQLSHLFVFGEMIGMNASFTADTYEISMESAYVTYDKCHKMVWESGYFKYKKLTTLCTKIMGAKKFISFLTYRVLNVKVSFFIK